MFAITNADSTYFLEVPADQELTLVVEPPAGMRLDAVYSTVVQSESGMDKPQSFLVRKWVDNLKSNPTDFNADGYPDIVYATSTGAYVQTGSDTLDLDISAPQDGFIYGATADFNADGYADIVWHNPATGQNILTLMQTGQTTANVTLPTLANTGWKLVGAGDFNGDDQYDLLWQHAGIGTMTVWTMNQSDLTGFAVLPQVRNANWKVVGVIDMDYDGDADIIWNNAQTNAILEWRMNGKNIEGFKTIVVPKIQRNPVFVGRKIAYTPVHIYCELIEARGMFYPVNTMGDFYGYFAGWGRYS